MYTAKSQSGNGKNKAAVNFFTPKMHGGRLSGLSGLNLAEVHGDWAYAAKEPVGGEKRDGVFLHFEFMNRSQGINEFSPDIARLEKILGIY